MVLAYGLSARIYWSRLEKRSRALRGRNPTRDIQAPVRQWRVRPLVAFVTRGRFLQSHWTPDLCLRKSCGAAAFGVTACVCARFRRMNRILVARGLRRDHRSHGCRRSARETEWEPVNPRVKEPYQIRVVSQ
jgi:hypothetical protein